MKFGFSNVIPAKAGIHPYSVLYLWIPHQVRNDKNNIFSLKPTTFDGGGLLLVKAYLS